jgi:hypothetical protein
VAVMEEEAVAEVEVVMAAVAAQVAVAHAVAAVEAAVTGAAAVVVVVEAAIAEHHANHLGLFAHPCVHADGALRLNSKALFILNTPSKIQKLRKSHGYRTYSLHHQA